MSARVGRLLIGFWPRQRWLRFGGLGAECSCCVWNFYAGPFGIEWARPGGEW